MRYSQFSLSKLLPCFPRNLSADLAQFLQRSIAKLHTTEFDHSRVQAQRRPNIVLCPARGIVSHDEVVSIVVLRLMLTRSFWQGEHAPILDAADRSAGPEDQRASGAHDPEAHG